MIDVKIISLFFSSFWLKSFIFLLHAALYYFVSRHAANKLFDFSYSNWFLHVSFAFSFCCFLKCWLLWYKNGNSAVLRFDSSSIINSFSHIQFSRLSLGTLSRGKETKQFLVFLSILNIMVSSFCWYFLIFWPFIYSTSNMPCLEAWSCCKVTAHMGYFQLSCSSEI